MASKLKALLINSFAGGLNVYSNATQVEDAESPDLLNVEFSGIGSVKKRQGYIKLTTAEVATGKRVQGPFSYITSTVREILFISNGVVYKYNGAGGKTQITGGTYSTTADINCAQIGSRLYFYDGVTALSYYDGTNIVTTGVVAAPSFPERGIFFNQRQYINSTANRDRVYFSKPLVVATGAATDTGDFTSPGTTSGFFGFGTGYEVIGFARQQQYLYVFCKRAIFRIEPIVTSGQLDHTSVAISSAIGCRAPRSIENVNNDIYFLDSTVYSLGEVATYIALRTTNVSAKVSKIFDGMSQSKISKAAAIYSTQKEAYLLAIQVGTGTYNDQVVGFSLPYKSWFLWDSMRVNYFMEFIDSTDVKHLYFGSDDSAASYVYEAFQGTNDNSAAISAYYYTKEFDSKTFDTEKIYQMWSVQFGGVYGVVTVDFLVDGVVVDTVSITSGSSSAYADGIGSMAIGTFAVGLEYNTPDVSATDPGINNDWRRHDVNGKEGTTFQFKFSNATVGQSFEIKQALVRYIDFSSKPYKVDSSKEV